MQRWGGANFDVGAVAIMLVKNIYIYIKLSFLDLAGSKESRGDL